LLALQLGFGVEGVWFALAAGTLIQAIYIQTQWRRGRWLEVALRKSPLYESHLQHLSSEVRWRFVDTIRTPVMANNEAREHVNEIGVSYNLPEGTVVVEFANDDFWVSEGRQYIPRPVPKTTPVVAPAYD
jgi:hypothetical protein